MRERKNLMRMKKLISVVLVVVMCLSLCSTAFADNGNSTGLNVAIEQMVEKEMTLVREQNPNASEGILEEYRNYLISTLSNTLYVNQPSKRFKFEHGGIVEYTTSIPSSGDYKVAVTLLTPEDASELFDDKDSFSVGDLIQYLLENYTGNWGTIFELFFGAVAVLEAITKQDIADADGYAQIRYFYSYVYNESITRVSGWHDHPFFIIYGDFTVTSTKYFIS